MKGLLTIALSLGVGAACVWAHPTSPRPVTQRARPRPRPPVKKVDADEGKPWIGIGIKDGLRGVEVTLVVDGTPARQAGLATGDEIVAIDKRAVSTAIDLQSRIGGFKVGQRVKLDVMRRTRKFTVTVKLAMKLDDQEQLERLRLDRAAPALEVLPVGQDADDKSEALSLSGLRGKVVVVEFLATWCGPCKSTYGELGALQARRRGDGLVVIGVSEESDASLRALASQEKIAFTLARDVGSVGYHAFHERLANRVTPTLFVIDRQGVVRFAGMGAGVTLDHAVFAAERALGDSAD